MRFAPALAAVLILSAFAAPSAFAYGSHYRSSDGSWVHVPYRGRHQGETAICRDGTHSMSHHHRGTCSHHGGVRMFER